MSQAMVLSDNSVNYKANEAAVIVAALAFVLVLGSVSLAAIMICGWRGARQVAFDWMHMKVTFYCR